MRLKTILMGLVLTMAALAPAAWAQGLPTPPVQFGLEAGANFSNFIGDSASIGTLTDKRLGFIGGGYLSINLSPSFAIRPEVLYEQKGAAVTGTSTSAELDYIEVPVLLKIGLGTPIISPNILLGASVGWNTLAKSQSGGTISNINQSDVALIGGVELDIDKFNISGRYELGVENVTTNTNFQNGTITLLAGYSFL
jgi:hypothetical protein